MAREHNKGCVKYVSSALRCALQYVLQVQRCMCVCFRCVLQVCFCHLTGSMFAKARYCRPLEWRSGSAGGADRGVVLFHDF